MKKRLQKAARKGYYHLEEKELGCKLGFETVKEDASRSFSGAAHVTQLLTLLPNPEGRSNLKVGKGLSGYVKITKSILTDETKKP